MTTHLSEDDLYRTSTQYRLWSFSPEQLAAQRETTHELALARARQYATEQNGSYSEAFKDDIPEYLTKEEELRLVQRYCELIRTTSDHLKWPTNIKATAVQYLKRFYLSNSCMTYPPKEIYKTVLFMASKTEAFHLTVPKFAQSISSDPDTILAPEYKVMQALRFTLDVRQPFRGLKGVLMELLNMADGLMGPVNGTDGRSGSELQEAMSATRPPSEKCRTTWKASTANATSLQNRIQAAYASARTILDAPASVTDAYFLYTPSQILLAAMHMSDEPLTSFYLDTKLPLPSPSRPKILATIQSCAALMASYDPKGGMTKDERAALEKKLDACRDPTTKDLVRSHAAMKQGVGDDEEKKRKKGEKEKSSREMDDLFGPSLGKKQANGAG